jgi:hypothetical protein
VVLKHVPRAGVQDVLAHTVVFSPNSVYSSLQCIVSFVFSGTRVPGEKSPTSAVVDQLPLEGFRGKRQ